MTLINALLEFLLNPWFLISLIFWIIVVLFAYLLRNKKEAAYLFFPILAMFRTKRLNKLIKKIAGKAPKTWKVFWTIGIFVSFGFTIFAFYFFFTNFINLIINPKVEQAVVPIIPGVTINLPLLFYMVLPLLFIVTTHEFAHGIAASADGVDIKSTGVLGAGLFYLVGLGAFVEVDERELSSLKFHRNTRLRIAAAGTYINGITAGIAFILLLSFPLMISPFYRNVAQINSVLKQEEGGFNYGNVTKGDVILAIKKKDTPDTEYINIDNYNKKTLSNILNNKTSLICSVGDNLSLKIYQPSNDKKYVKNVTLGPRYNLGIRYKYISNSELEITKVYTDTEGGNNYGNITVGVIINKIDGIPINVTNGDTLEKRLTTFNLKTINFSIDSTNWTLDVDVIGVVIGIFTNSYFMHKNDLAKFFTSFTPEFLLREVAWLFIIAFSITLFNMVPLPIFDGDRMVKELINWGIGEDYKTIKKKTEKLLFKEDVNEYNLSEYRVENVNSVKLLIDGRKSLKERSEIDLAEEKYNLIDKFEDGYKETLVLDLPKETRLGKNSIIEVSYEYWHDRKKPLKMTLLNIIRVITLIIILGNFILSFVKFGALTFWI
ncbi:MAG: site-2 protease family protein [Promethearchaeota archaeon]